MDAFAEHGFAATRLDDVAKRAGVSKGTIYFYFETKEQLFEEMVRNYARIVLEDAEVVLVHDCGSCAERLREFIIFVYRRCMHDRVGRGTIRFMVSESKSFPKLAESLYNDVFAPVMLVVAGLLAEGALKGEFRREIAAHPEVVVASAVFFSVIRSIFADEFQLDDDRLVAVQVELMLNGLLTSSARGSPALSSCPD